MNPFFDPWKQYVLKNENVYHPEEMIERPEINYIGDTKVYLFQNYTYTAGMWLQTNDNDNLIRMFTCAGDYEKRFVFSFDGEHEEGPIHQHNTIEIGYVVEGCACQSFFGKEYQFKQGDFWLVDRNCYHSDKYRSGGLFTVYISIPSDVFDSAFVDSVGNTEVQRFLSIALLQQKKNRQFLHFKPLVGHVEGGRLMEQLLREIVEHKVGYQSISKGLLARLLSVLSSEYEFLLNSQDQRKINDLIYCEVEKFIQENYRTVTVRELMERFHYNEDFYNRLIKEYSGYTYSDYLKNVRLLEAEKMMRNTEYSIEQIANLVGYQSMGHFYQLFTDRYGMTPAKYRKQFKL